jgi:hypothetical protein
MALRTGWRRRRSSPYFKPRARCFSLQAIANFLLDYELVDRIRFATNEPRAKEWRDDRRARSCAVCARTTPAVRFSTDAHLLPACTGNRYLYTANECDECNLGSGKETEDELGKMLGPHRAVHRVQTRNRPSATHKLHDGGSSIGGQQRGEPLRLSMVDGSTTISMRDVGDNTIKIDVEGAPFRPIAALRSLGRTAWHMLPQHVRARNHGFLDWIRGTTPSGTISYLDVMVPGPGLRHTTFAVWSRQRDDDAQPALVYMLAYGTTLLVVPHPAKIWEERPVPALPRSPFGPPRVKITNILRDEPVEQKFSYDVRYLSRSLRHFAAPIDARLTLTNASHTHVRLDAEIDTVSQSGDSNTIEYVVHGGDLCGELRIVGTPLKLLEDGRLAGGRFTATHCRTPERRSAPSRPGRRSRFSKRWLPGATSPSSSTSRAPESSPRCIFPP